MIQFLRKLKFADREVTALQDNVALILNQVTKKIVIDGVQLKAVLIPAGEEIRVNHKLGRIPEGYFVSGAITPLAPLPYSSARDANTITLGCASFDVTLDLWIY